MGNVFQAWSQVDERYPFRPCNHFVTNTISFKLTLAFNTPVFCSKGTRASWVHPGKPASERASQRVSESASKQASIPKFVGYEPRSKIIIVAVTTVPVVVVLLPPLKAGTSCAGTLCGVPLFMRKEPTQRRVRLPSVGRCKSAFCAWTSHRTHSCTATTLGDLACHCVGSFLMNRGTPRRVRAQSSTSPRSAQTISSPRRSAVEWENNHPCCGGRARQTARSGGRRQTNSLQRS